MQNKLLHVFSKLPESAIVDSTVSLSTFIKKLKVLTVSGGGVKSRMYQMVLDLIEGQEELSGSIAPELIYATLSPPFDQEAGQLWALSSPLADTIFYCTDAFSAMFDKGNPGTLRWEVSGEDEIPAERARLEFVYQLIMEKIYHFSADSRPSLNYCYRDPDCNLPRYYRIHADTAFVEITAKGPLPRLDIESLEPYLEEGTGIEILTKVLPLSLFRFEGFTVLTLEDVTTTHAVETIRKLIGDFRISEEELNEKVLESLKAIAGDNNFEFGLMPFFTLNGKYVMSDDGTHPCLLQKRVLQSSIGEAALYEEMNKYVERPKPVFVRDIHAEKYQNHPFLEAIRNSGVNSYAVLPVIHNKSVAGILEISSYRTGVSFEGLLSRLENVLPLLAQLLQSSIERFNASIEGVIKEQFTSLQPAVQWKFNEVALDYLMKTRSGKATIGNVSFNDVHPLYGAVDIRNSTMERNIALQADIIEHLKLLLHTFDVLHTELGVPISDQIVQACKKWLDQSTAQANTNEEILFERYLDTGVRDHLLQLADDYPIARPYIDRYVTALKEGSLTLNRQRLEESMQQINSVLNQYLDKANEKIQEQYPCYFEKIRTDGVEYDIYIGQSIVPERKFDNQYLTNLKRWQLKSMVEVGRLTYSLLGNIPVGLRTTQLIFVHPYTINISFRKDEKRFDVEGTYNIRYEIIKKRIDKILVRHTGERLTQPDKIAVIYSNIGDGAQYTAFIRDLQGQGFLKDDLEILELEDLQGVSGLNALRVGIAYETKEHETID